MNLTAVYVQSGESVAAWIEELPGVNTHGATLEEARANLRDALAQVVKRHQEELRRALEGKTVLSREALPEWAERTEPQVRDLQGAIAEGLSSPLGPWEGAAEIIRQSRARRGMGG